MYLIKQLYSSVEGFMLDIDCSRAKNNEKDKFGFLIDHKEAPTNTEVFILIHLKTKNLLNSMIMLCWKVLS